MDIAVMFFNGQTVFYIVLGFLVFGPFITFLIGYYFCHSRSLLQHWATANGYAITHAEMRSIRTGPFSGTGRMDQAVFYVTVRGSDGQERSCWLRCGSRWSGILSDNIEVKWEE